jgi:methyltransferase-like protein 6
MKEGGILYFRDYGRYDYMEMKFAKKPKAKLKEHFFIREDLTRAYFFGLEEINELAAKAGFKVLEGKNLYTEITNRQMEKSMYRVWIQAKYIK